MIEYISVDISDFKRSKAFYLAALEPLGYGLVDEVLVETTGAPCNNAVFGRPGSYELFIGDGGKPVTGRLTIGIIALNRASVRAFHAAAVAAGGREGSAPSAYPDDNPEYYTASVFDPDGNKIAAVCRRHVLYEDHAT